jgi:hypothetical protein
MNEPKAHIPANKARATTAPIIHHQSIDTIVAPKRFILESKNDTLRASRRRGCTTKAFRCGLIDEPFANG